jgi:hypothetical protein
MGGSRRTVAYAFASSAYLSSDGAGGFRAVDTEGNGFKRSVGDSARVQPLDVKLVPNTYVGLGRMIPTLYLRHFTKQHVAIFDFMTLPHGGTTFRVQQDNTKRTLSEKDIREGAPVHVDMSFTLDATGRVTSIHRKFKQAESTETFAYSENDTVPWFVPVAVQTTDSDNWVLVDAGTIEEASCAAWFAQPAITVKVATVTAQMKQDHIDEQGGFDALMQRNVSQTLRVQTGQSGSGMFTAAIVAAIVGVGGLALLVWKRRRLA